jgi:hypothetical protein
LGVLPARDLDFRPLAGTGQAGSCAGAGLTSKSTSSTGATGNSSSAATVRRTAVRRGSQ